MAHTKKKKNVTRNMAPTENLEKIWLRQEKNVYVAR